MISLSTQVNQKNIDGLRGIFGVGLLAKKYPKHRCKLANCLTLAYLLVAGYLLPSSLAALPRHVAGRSQRQIKRWLTESPKFSHPSAKFSQLIHSNHNPMTQSLVCRYYSQPHGKTVKEY